MPKLILKLLDYEHPAAVGVISDPLMLKEVASLPADSQKELCDVVEIRQDLLGLEPEALLEAVQPLVQPLLLTLRHPAEGGVGPTAAKERSSLLLPLLPRVQLLDVELQFAPELLECIRQAQSLGVRVVGSFHNFQETPPLEVLLQAHAEAQRLGLDAVKMACMLKDTGDLLRLGSLFEQRDPKVFPMSVMGMGALGRVSRLLFSKLGSVLNYGYLGAANAPGQWPAQELKQLIAQL
jgi:3-dehydroquinate dehydratase I